MKYELFQSILLKLRSRLIGAIFFFLALLIVVPILEAESYEIFDQSFEFKTGGTVKIDNPSGEVKIEVWAEELVHVVAKKVEPAGHPVALSDMAFFNTRNQIQIKTQPAEKTTRIDLTVYIPRNTSLRIITSSGAVQIRGAIASALVETSAGNIKLESPASQDADLVATTTNGTIKAEIPIETYGTPSSKAVQGKLNSGGNPVILRSNTGNIQLSPLQYELDKNVATIPAVSPISSSGDSNNYYSGNNNNSNTRNNAGNVNDDSLFGGAPPTVSRRPNNNNNDNYQPYTYGGSYGGNTGGNLGNQPSNNSGNRGGNSGNSNADIFGAGRRSDNTSNTVDAGNLGLNRSSGNSDIDSQGGVGVRIIPPPGASRPQQNNDYNNQNNQYNPNNSNNPQNYPAQPPPLQRRKNSISGNTNNNDSNQNNQYNPSNDNSRINNSPSNNNDFDDIASNRPNNGPTPTIRRDNSSNSNNPNNNANNNDDSDDDTIKIDTKLVSLNVSVMSRDGRAVTNLKQNDFYVFEDGIQQKIEHFESVNTPFNLVILLDLSGSILDKIDVLRRAVLRFIETSKPQDRIAIVSFTRSVQVVCELTNDRQLIKQRLQYMTMPKGGTAFYEATWFTVTQMFKQYPGERNAVVLLSDGVDNSISVTYPIPSRVTFDQVLRKVQESGVLVFPIYLDTEKENVSQDIEGPESYVLARRQLGALAETSGGVYFKADRPDNLEGVYEKVAADLRTLYSVGYYPSNSTRDGSWRKLKVKIDKPDLAVRTRRGYYAN
jgi:VWFA-related protein